MNRLLNIDKYNIKLFQKIQKCKTNAIINTIIFPKKSFVKAIEV